MRAEIKKATGEVALVKPKQANFRAKVKQVIVRLACWGVIPINLADWLIRLWGLSNE
jgi:hypothetical protein